MPRPEPTGEAMRRTRAGGYPIKARRRNTATLKRRNAPKATRSRSSPTAVKETKVARLTRELQEALAQQTATSDVLRVISSSPGDLQPVFESVLANAAKLCPAAYGAMWLCEGDGFRAAAIYGDLPAAFTELSRSGALCSVPGRECHWPESPRPGNQSRLTIFDWISRTLTVRLCRLLLSKPASELY